MGQSRAQLTVAVCVATIPPRRELLERALESVRTQTRRPDEVVVQLDVDGEGAGPTRNRAWRRATTDYVAFLDDDDELLPDHLQRCLGAAKAERADLVYPWFELYNERGRRSHDEKLACPVNGRLVNPLGIRFGPEQAAHLRRHAWIPATVVVRRSFLEAVDGYPSHDSEEYERYQRCEDWAFLNRLLDVHAKFVHVPHRTWRWRTDHQTTGGRSWRQDSSVRSSTGSMSTTSS